MSSGRTALEQEAAHLHARFFRRPAPTIVIERYVTANQVCFPNLDERTCRMLDTIVNRGLDVEAVEAYLRLRRNNRILTRKVQVLFYLVEVRAAYYYEFVNHKPGLARALASLVGAGLGAAWKYLKGWYLVSVHDFV